MIAYETTFTSRQEIEDNFIFNYPWGTPDSLNGTIVKHTCSFDTNGLTMKCTKEDPYGNGLVFFYMPRIFWKKEPFSYGLFTAEMEVPKQSAVVDFVLYSAVRYKYGIRSILPEIDIAEYGIHNEPQSLNAAIHKWKNPPSFLLHPDYHDEEKKHSLDYYQHFQKNNTIPWPQMTVNKHECEITKRSVKIYCNGKKIFSYCGSYYGCIEGGFMPTFGISIPLWINNPDPKPVVLKSFKIEQ